MRCTLTAGRTGGYRLRWRVPIIGGEGAMALKAAAAVATKFKSVKAEP
jgi:hypothetical protein